MNLIPFLFCEMGFFILNRNMLPIVKRGKAYIMLKFKGMIIALDKKGTTYLNSFVYAFSSGKFHNK